MTGCDRTQLTQRFEHALVYATHLHASQYRKDERVPYISHLLSVAAIVLEAGGDEDDAIAALLHDAVEDQGGEKTRAEIRQKFGDRVTTIVDGCTEVTLTPEASWQERKVSYLQQLEQSSLSVRLISLADKLHNARSLLASLHHDGTDIWHRFNGGREGMLWFYQALNKIYQNESSDYLSQEFDRLVTELTTFGMIK